MKTRYSLHALLLTLSLLAAPARSAPSDLDPSFGTGGKVVTPIGSGDDILYAMALQADGKIVVAGASSNGNNLDVAVVRYTVIGALDTSFGMGGKVTTPIGNGDDYGFSVAIQGDGKIVVAGRSFNGSDTDISGSPLF